MRTLTASILCILVAGAVRAGDGRVEISQAAMPCAIVLPGSYIVTENLTGTAASNGITIATNDVTLDFNGFELAGVPGSLDGVVAPAARRNVTLVNGTVRGWGDDGIDLARVTNVVARALRVSDNQDDGLRVGDASRVTECTLLHNGGDALVAGIGCLVATCVARENSDSGLVVSNGCIVKDSVTRENSGDGIRAGDGATVTGCNARSNGQNGIRAGGGSVVLNCIGYDNALSGILLDGAGGNVAGCSVRGNLEYGVRAFNGCSVTTCAASDNSLGAYWVASNCYVRANNAYMSGTTATHSAYAIIGRDNRIELNHASAGLMGYVVQGASNIVVRNSAIGNVSSNFSIAPGNASGGQTGNPDTAAPWANISF